MQFRKRKQLKPKCAEVSLCLIAEIAGNVTKTIQLLHWMEESFKQPGISMGIISAE